MIPFAGVRDGKPQRSLAEAVDEIVRMAQALRAISDPIVRREILRQMRDLLAEAESLL